MNGVVDKTKGWDLGWNGETAQRSKPNPLIWLVELLREGGRVFHGVLQAQLVPWVTLMGY